ncbi:hypothetical protein BN2537_6333 [Streptomyces venezuelae]|nr:hypothetical protein BN2537_6333 [Streptomyces venezuelae]
MARGHGCLRFSRIVGCGVSSSYARRADAPRLCPMVRGSRARGFPARIREGLLGGFGMCPVALGTLRARGRCGAAVVRLRCDSGLAGSSGRRDPARRDHRRARILSCF